MITRCALLLCAVFNGQTPSPSPPGTYSPLIAPASDEAELARKALKPPAALRAELFAAEPLLANPVAFWIDPRGRVFVAETFRHHAGVTDNRAHLYWLDEDLASRTVEDRIALHRRHDPNADQTYTAEQDRLRLLVDMDDDGHADRSTVFADGFHSIESGLGAGVLSRGNDVWYTCIPDLWLLRDTDGDGVADERRSLHRGFGVHVAFLGHDLHGLTLGPDGKLYFSVGDRGLHVTTGERTLDLPDTGAVLRCELDGSGLELFATGLRNPQELVFNDLGDLFTGDNNSDGGDRARWVHLVEGSDSGWRVGYQYAERPVTRGPWNAEKLWLPRGEEQAAYVLPPVANLGDGPSGVARFPGTGMPERFSGKFLVCDFRGVPGISGIRSFSLEQNGATYSLVNADQFLWGTLATDCDFGPDGSLYVLDWVSGWEKPGKGRVFRLLPEDPAAREAGLATRALLARGFSTLATSELTQLLTHQDCRVRQEAQLALAAKGVSAVPALFGVARASEDQRARLHAVWALGQMARRDTEVRPAVAALLEHVDPEIRAQAARICGDLRLTSTRQRLVALLREPFPRLQLNAALALGKVGGAEDVPALFELLRTNADRDLFVRHGAVFALAGIADEAALVARASDPAVAVRRGALLALRRLRAPGTARFLRDPDLAVVLEAARAVHDVPIEPGLPELAALEIGPATSEPLALRIVHSSYRVGSQAGAESLARTAADSSLAITVRVEALRLLGLWPSPPGRDQLLGLWRPVARLPGSGELAAAALAGRIEGILGNGPDELRLTAIETARRLALGGAAPALGRLTSDPAVGARTRALALSALERLEPAEATRIARVLIQASAPEVRLEARKILAAHDPQAALPLFEQALGSGTILEQQSALAALGTIRTPRSAEILGEWLGKIEAGTLPPELSLDLLEACRAQGSADLTAALTQREAKLPAGDPLARYRECLAGGDAEKGRQVFFEKREVACQRCHKTDRPGGEVGPDLANLGLRAKREDILLSIVAPNAKIAEGFASITLATQDGRVLSGVLRGEDGERIRLVSPDGVAISVEKADVAERAVGLSAMPEDLVKHLTPRELRDLVEFLSSLKVDPTRER